MNERRRILSGDKVADGVTLKVTTTDGSTNAGIYMTIINGDNMYPVTTDSRGKAVITGLSGGCTIDCTTHFLSVTEFVATGTMTVNIRAHTNTFPLGIREYPYTGSYSEVDLTPGQYRLQCWGAQGGSNKIWSGFGITQVMAGGKGGYAEGILTIDQNTTVRVYVGGQGTSTTGGFNGGGNSTIDGYSSHTATSETGCSSMGAGGGATDIRLSDGSLYSRFLVAGGGSGGAMCMKETPTGSGNRSTLSQNGYVGGGSHSGGYSSTYYATSTSAGKNGSFAVQAIVQVPAEEAGMAEVGTLLIQIWML